jgi:predicted Zn finger-like uncharacterized protein
MSSYDFRRDYAIKAPGPAATSKPAACPTCKSPAITTTAKSPDADSYWRCSKCGEVWNDSRTRSAQRGGPRWR